MKQIFIYSVCGDAHVHLVNTSIQFLKRFTRSDILVVTCRSDTPVHHDQVIPVWAPDHLDNHRASILLKTSLHTIVGDLRHDYCYLDSDILAVHRDVDTIFRHRYGPVTFASDHVGMDVFSRYAVRCACTSGRCDHLHSAIKETFDIEVADPAWRHWNGGVFLFNHESADFMNAWHRHTRQIFDDPRWRVRDQGTLIATAWEFGLQDQATIPGEFNFIVDAMWGIRSEKRADATVSDYYVDERYSLDPFSEKPHPRLLHFINGGIGKKGWKNWDDVEQLLERTVPAGPVVHRAYGATTGTEG